MAFLLLCLESALRERKRVMPLIVVLLWALGGTAPASAQSARSLVGEGNQSYSEKQYSEALKHYQEAEAVAPDSPQIWFNKGDALYQQGQFAEAIDAYEKAAIASGSSRLQAFSKYNQGNASFQSGKTKAQMNPQEAISDMRRGLELYHDALDADPSMDAARHNIEVTKRAIQKLVQLQQQQQGDSDDGDQKDQQQQQQQQSSDDNQQDQQDQQDQQQQQSGQQEEQEQEDQQQAQQQQQQQQEMQQAAEDPEDILDEERENRLKRQLQTAVGVEPVDKDW